MKKKSLNILDGVRTYGCIVVVKAIKPDAPIVKVATAVPDVSLLTTRSQELIEAKYREEFGYKDDVMIGIWDEDFLDDVYEGVDVNG